MTWGRVVVKLHVVTHRRFPSPHLSDAQAFDLCVKLAELPGLGGDLYLSIPTVNAVMVGMDIPPTARAAVLDNGGLVDWLSEHFLIAYRYREARELLQAAEAGWFAAGFAEDHEPF